MSDRQVCLIGCGTHREIVLCSFVFVHLYTSSWFIRKEDKQQILIQVKIQRSCRRTVCRQLHVQRMVFTVQNWCSQRRKEKRRKNQVTICESIVFSEPERQGEKEEKSGQDLWKCSVFRAREAWRTGGKIGIGFVHLQGSIKSLVDQHH